MEAEAGGSGTEAGGSGTFSVEVVPRVLILVHSVLLKWKFNNKRIKQND